GRRVLLVDLDPQGSATVSLGFQKSKLLYTVYDALAQSRKIEEVMLGTKVENLDRKSTRLNSSHVSISYAVFCLKKKIFYSNFSPRQNSLQYSSRSCNSNTKFQIANSPSNRYVTSAVSPVYHPLQRFLFLQRPTS